MWKKEEGECFLHFRDVLCQMVQLQAVCMQSYSFPLRRASKNPLFSMFFGYISAVWGL